VILDEPCRGWTQWAGVKYATLSGVEEGWKDGDVFHAFLSDAEMLWTASA